MNEKEISITHISCDIIPQLFREHGGKVEGAVACSEHAKENTSKKHVICCKHCKAAITSTVHKIIIDSTHSHTFFNPAGLVFEIGCFKSATGSIVKGTSEKEFSWFAGYVWRYAVCGTCASHLGWHFANGNDVFYGLVLNRLIEIALD